MKFLLNWFLKKITPMDKLWSIIKREYIIRVRKKSFLAVTLLVPLAFALFSFGMGFLSTYFMNKSKPKIIVKDDSGIFKSYILDKQDKDYNFTNDDLNKIKENYKKSYDLLIYIPKYDGSQKFSVKYFSDKKIGLMFIEKYQRKISKALKEYKKKSLNIDPEVFKQLDIKVNLINGDISENDSQKEKLSMGISTSLSFAMGFLLYMVVFIFGAQVMRSVMEEKINRIVEVVISSVKPFQLMLGKIIGVGSVGLTQLLIWLLLIPVVLAFTNLFLKQKVEESEMKMPKLSGHEFTQVIDAFFDQNWLLIIPFFILFFIAGYFLYASMFAALGAAVGDDMSDVQGLTTVITLPVIAGLIIMMNSINNPDGSLAIFGSIFPLTSPIVMPSRLPFSPPIWQILLSLVLLIITILGIVLLSAKIYRAGILMYGKKLSLNDMFKILRDK